MLIECSRCGAPLDVPAGAAVARCNYCRSSHRVDQARPLAPRTPVGWTPPRTWTPPDHAPHPSRRLTYHANRSAGSKWLLVLLPLVAVVVASVVFALFTRGAQNRGNKRELETELVRVPLGQFVKLELAQAPAAFEQAYPQGKLSEGGARLELDGEFDSAHVSWNQERDRITRIDLLASKPVDTAPLVEALGAQLGRHFEKNSGSYGANYSDGTMISLNPKGTQLFFTAAPDHDRRSNWEARGQALWHVMAAVASKSVVNLAPDTRKLLTGYTLKEMTVVDATKPVDDAEAHVRAVLPGAVASQLIDLKLEVFADHPWFGTVSFSWENKKDGRLNTVQFWNPSTQPDLADRDGIAKCLEPVMGPVKVTIQDHLKQEKLYQWNLRTHFEDGGNITKNNVWIRIPEGKRGQERLRALLSALDGCGS